MTDLDYRLEDFLSQVELEICEYLNTQKNKFPNSSKLLKKFTKRKDDWIHVSNHFRELKAKEKLGCKENSKSKEKTKLQDNIIIRNNELAEVVNELCIAKLFVEDITIDSIEYEPIVFKGDKSIDFHLKFIDGQTAYCDVKTIHPDDTGNWKQYQRALKNKLFPSHASFDLQQDSLGGILWHHSFASRTKMLEHVIEFEEKIVQKAINSSRKIMLFCGDGFRLSKDELEDFADFYYTEKYRKDDFMQLMEAYSMEKEAIILLRNIDYIAYFERKPMNLEYKFIPRVHGSASI